MLKRLIQIGGIANLTGATLLVLWCVGILFCMGGNIFSEDYPGMVTNPVWMPVNLTGLAGFSLLLIGILGIYIQIANTVGRMPLIGFLILLVAITLHSCIHFYETIFWPVIATGSPEFFKAVVIPPTSLVINIMYIMRGILWATGFLLLGIGIVRAGSFPRFAGIMLIAGAILFGIGTIPVIRSIGMFPMAAGMVILGIRMVNQWDEAEL